MPNFPRTDLAVEAEAIHRSAAAVTELPGVRAEETNRRGFSVTEVHVLDAAGENALCKPIGDYYTLALDPLLRREDDAFENAAQTLAELLRGVLPLMPDASVLVVGLGNRAITPDAVGPDAIDSVMVTRHLREQLPELEILEYEPMRAHCSFRIGGPAKRMAFPSDGAQMVLLVNFAMECGTKPLIIGNGSNLLVPDEGLDRLVIDTSAYMNKAQLGNEPNTITAEAGATLAKTADFACKAGLSGLEFAHGIPGTVGGGVCMNAGAYGGEMKQVLTCVRILFPEEGVKTLTNEELKLGYRHSILSECPEAVVLSATMRLRPDKEKTIRDTMRELMRKRKGSQPLEWPSAGSTFKRPEGYFAGTLIDQCGLKGLTVGGAQVSEKHAGFLINRGGASFADMTELISQVQQRVFEQTGVHLEPEVKIVG